MALTMLYWQCGRAGYRGKATHALTSEDEQRERAKRYTSARALKFMLALPLLLHAYYPEIPVPGPPHPCDLKRSRSFG